uniref:KHA domain-containing protein n=1 Tax=Rhinopithecus bieti TaxID=61621 RepID=A0A2K6N1X8_RHIBE
MRRVTLFLNGTLFDLLSVASSKLGIKDTSVYKEKGGLIDDIALIRDDDEFVRFLVATPTKSEL